MKGQVAACESVRKLEAIKPGELVVYYRGDLVNDLMRCKRRAGEKDGGAPKTEALLLSIRDTTDRLVLAGKIRIKREMIPLGAKVVQGATKFQYKYTAIGC